MTSLRITAPSSNTAWKEVEYSLGSRIVRIERVPRGHRYAYDGFRAIGATGGVWYIDGDTLCKMIGGGYPLGDVESINVDEPFGGRAEYSAFVGMDSALSSDVCVSGAVYPGSLRVTKNPTDELREKLQEHSATIRRLENAVVESMMDGLRVIPVTPTKDKKKEASRRVYWNRVHNKRKKQ